MRHSTPAPASRASADELGAAAVEMALVLPILVLMLFGIVEFGRGYSIKASLTSAAREGARVLALGTDDPKDVVLDAVPGLDTSKITVTTTAKPCLHGTEATVTATYPFTYDVPLFGKATVTLTAKGSMWCEL